MTQLVHYEGGAEKNKVCVAVRFRPLRCAEQPGRPGPCGLLTGTHGMLRALHGHA